MPRIQAYAQVVGASVKESGREARVAVEAAVIISHAETRRAVHFLEKYHDRVGSPESPKAITARRGRANDEIRLLAWRKRKSHKAKRFERTMVGRSKGRVERLNLALVDRRKPGSGQQRLGPIACWAIDQTLLERVVHDRVFVPRGTVHIAGIELANNVVEGLFAGPVIRRTTEIGVYGRFVPDDTGIRVLMFVGKAERMTDLVNRRVDAPSITLVDVHGAVELLDAENVAANVGPMATVAFECDSDLSFVERGDLLELETNADVFPRTEAIARLALVRRAAHPA